MNRSYASVIGAALCVIGLTGSALAWEIEPIQKLEIDNIAARAVLATDLGTVCSASEEPAYCRLQFEFADQGFVLAERALIMAAIAHEGKLQEHLLADAQKWHDQGWILYGIALAQTMLTDDTFAQETAKIPAQ